LSFNNFRNKSNAYSRKFLSSLKKRLALLTTQPLTGIVTDEDGILVLVWDNYYIFYIVNETNIKITSVHHQKENISR